MCAGEVKAATPYKIFRLQLRRREIHRFFLSSHKSLPWPWGQAVPKHGRYWGTHQETVSTNQCRGAPSGTLPTCALSVIPPQYQPRATSTQDNSSSVSNNGWESTHSTFLCRRESFMNETQGNERAATHTEITRINPMHLNIEVQKMCSPCPRRAHS